MQLKLFSMTASRDGCHKSHLCQRKANQALFDSVYQLLAALSELTINEHILPAVDRYQLV